ncbi:MAG: hypothetical protein ACLSX5_06770 [Lachnospiraceae bacterium]
MKSYHEIKEKITDITLYLYQIKATRTFSFGTWTSRQHVFLSIKAGGHSGYGENIISVNQPDVSLDNWKKYLNELIGMQVGDAITYLRERLDVWQDRMTEMTEMALIDLWGKLEKKSALELLELPGREEVCGVYVILSDDLNVVEEKVKYAVSCGKTRFIKVKLFGDETLDCQVVEMVRNYLPRKETYLIGDVNCGYRPEGTRRDLREIVQSMKRLYQAGLDACEDPAYLEKKEWKELQEQVHPLSLIPDYPMRPSRKACKTIIKGMGDCYNIHPGSAASVFDAVVLAEKIKELGADLMIGDDSLVGPGCTIWQQLAVGLSARWVEATEKEEDSVFYYGCIEKIPTDSRTNPIKFCPDCYGFGIRLDEEKLALAADKIERL